MLGLRLTSLGRACAAALALAAPFGAGTAVAADFPVHPTAITFPAAGTSHDFVKAAPVSDGFVAAWNRLTDGKTSVLIRRFAADGTQAGDVTVVEDGALASSAVEGRPEVVALGGDRIGVVWMGAGPKLKGAVYDAATGQLGAPVTYFSNGVLANVPRALALIENGNVALVTRRAVDGGEDTTLFMLDQTMKRVGDQIVEHDVSGSSKAGIYDFTVVAHRAGGVVIYRSADQRLVKRPFGGTGLLSDQEPIRKLQAFSKDSRNFADFTVTAKAIQGGGYATAWSDLSGGGADRKIFIASFDEFGAKTRRAQQQFDLGDQRSPDIFVFEQGFGVGYLNRSTLSGLVTHRASFFATNGLMVSREIVTEYYGTVGLGVVVNPVDASAFVGLSNGGSIRIFSAEGRIYGDRLPAPMIDVTGEQTTNRFNGTEGADMLLAAGGVDYILGQDDDDLIDAGTGHDRISGGAGNDVIYHDGANKRSPRALKGGRGADIFVFRNPAVFIQDFDAEDRLDLSSFGYATREDVLRGAQILDGGVSISVRDQTRPSIEGRIFLRRFKLKNLTAANIIN